MKMIIEGVLYNTDTATQLAEWTNRLGLNDLHYLVETLYQTKKGTFLLHGEGGAASQYSKSCGSNMRTGGQTLIKLSPEEVVEWMETRRVINDTLLEILGPLVKTE